MANKHHASKEWLYERIAGAISIPLLIWLVFNLAEMNCSYCHSSLAAFLSKTHNVILLVLFLINFLLYSTLAMKVVFEDYIHNIPLRNFLIKFMYIAGVSGFVLALAAILKIFLI